MTESLRNLLAALAVCALERPTDEVMFHGRMVPDVKVAITVASNGYVVGRT